MDAHAVLTKKIYSLENAKFLLRRFTSKSRINEETASHKFDYK